MMLTSFPLGRWPPSGVQSAVVIPRSLCPPLGGSLTRVWPRWSTSLCTDDQRAWPCHVFFRLSSSTCLAGAVSSD
ncbi:hypothetical protein XENOCAPTIV_017208, partial [Xenoophorus captivus]